MTKCTVYTEYKISSKKKAFDSHFRGLAITVSPKTLGQLTMYNTTNSNYFFIIKKKLYIARLCTARSKLSKQVSHNRAASVIRWPLNTCRTVHTTNFHHHLSNSKYKPTTGLILPCLQAPESVQLIVKSYHNKLSSS